MAPAHNMYQKVASTAAVYLGPAAERFIRRQITTHLGKRPEELTVKDIRELTSWVKQTLALLTENQELVEAFARDLNNLAKPATTANRRRGN